MNTDNLKKQINDHFTQYRENHFHEIFPSGGNPPAWMINAIVELVKPLHEKIEQYERHEQKRTGKPVNQD